MAYKGPFTSYYIVLGGLAILFLVTLSWFWLSSPCVNVHTIFGQFPTALAQSVQDGGLVLPPGPPPIFEGVLCVGRRILLFPEIQIIVMGILLCSYVKRLRKYRSTPVLEIKSRTDITLIVIGSLVTCVLFGFLFLSFYISLPI